MYAVAACFMCFVGDCMIIVSPVLARRKCFIYKCWGNHTIKSNDDVAVLFDAMITLAIWVTGELATKYFSFRVPSDLTETKKIDSKYNNHSNLSCNFFIVVVNDNHKRFH